MSDQEGTRKTMSHPMYNREGLLELFLLVKSNSRCCDLIEFGFSLLLGLLMLSPFLPGLVILPIPIGDVVLLMEQPKGCFGPTGDNRIVLCSAQYETLSPATYKHGGRSSSECRNLIRYTVKRCKWWAV